ncbi:chromosome partitioning protein ParB [bacterium]|nr:chromosome partitioning protein ParB [bacterium]
MNNEQDLDIDSTATDEASLVDWENPPSLGDLKQDYESAKVAHDVHITEVDTWLRVLNGEQTINAKRGRSKLVPKLARKQAEWRYAALSEPFLSTDDLFNTSPQTFEDKDSAVQNGMLLNYQLNCRMDKVNFIDEYIRTAVDEGTVVVRVGWEFEEGKRKIYEDVMEMQMALDPQTGQPAIDPQTGQPQMQEVKTGQTSKMKTVTLKNQPVLTVCDYNNIIVDPTCDGDLEKANFAIYSFETSLSELKKDGRYQNLDDINFESASVLSEPDHEVNTDDTSFTFKDKARKKVIAREYWGYWDIDDTGEVEPFVATWIGDTIIRMEKNPFPDKKIPFILVQYLPRRKNIYGEPDAALIEDNQKIVGAVTRGIIDIIGRSASGQQGIRKDALDVTNARKFERGEDYKFNANVDPRQAFHMEVYPEIPRSALEVLNMQNNDAEALTGVKAFTQGISGQALGTTATGIRSALDATSKRELGILRRLSNGLNQIGRKVISMNSEFLEDEEIIRITNEEFIAINRNDLGGKYDIKLNISTAEADEQKGSELAFMLQTMGNTMPPEMSQMILADIAKLRKMPDLAKRITEYQPQPDPMAQQKAQLEVALLQAQVANETAKGKENEVDVALKTAKTQTEQAKARSMHSGADLTDLDFVDKDSGTRDMREMNLEARKHDAAMQSKEYDRQANLESKEQDRLSTLDKAAFDTLNKQ